MAPPLLRALLALAPAACLAAPSAPVRLWPGTPPGDSPTTVAESDVTKPTDPKTGGRPVIHLGNVSDPTLTVYRAAKSKKPRPAVVVFPGGGYYILAWDLEGTEICDWLNSAGVTAVLVKYRVPRRPGLEPWAAPLQDAQRAMGLVRAHAAEWGIDPARVGVLGFSAGGNLCAVLSAHASPRTYPQVDAADAASCRPDFQILIYPAYLVKGGDGPDRLDLTPEVAVTAATPPTFLVMAEDDPIHVENVLGYALALKGAGVPLELHVYASGGHGYGLRAAPTLAVTWPHRAAEWMRFQGILPGR